MNELGEGSKVRRYMSKDKLIEATEIKITKS